MELSELVGGESEGLPESPRPSAASLSLQKQKQKANHKREMQIFNIGWVGKTKSLKHTQFLCQFYGSRKLNRRIVVEGCGVVVWFGKYTDIAFPVLLFGFTY